MLCFVVKHLGSGRALLKWGKTLDFVSCFPLHFFRALPLPACFTTEQSTVEASLFVKYSNIDRGRNLFIQFVFEVADFSIHLSRKTNHRTIHLLSPIHA